MRCFIGFALFLVLFFGSCATLKAVTTKTSGPLAAAEELIERPQGEVLAAEQRHDEHGRHREGDTGVTLEPRQIQHGDHRTG